MRLLIESALSHYFNGETSLEEIARVLDIPELSEETTVLSSKRKFEKEGKVKKILLLYSEKTVVKRLTEQLKKYDFAVTAVTSTRQALEFVNKEVLFDLVISELEERDINVFSLIASLRSHVKYAAIPVLVITEGGETEKNNKVIALGADDILTKPIKFNLLLNRILAVLKRTSLL